MSNIAMWVLTGVTELEGPVSPHVSQTIKHKLIALLDGPKAPKSGKE